MRWLILFVGFGVGLLSCNSAGNNERSTIADEVKVLDSRALFKKHCVLCHGANGKLQANNSKDLSISLLSKDQRIQVIKNGRNTMTGFGDILSKGEIEALADYTISLKKE